MNPSAKAVIYRMPIVGKWIRHARLRWACAANPFHNSAAYWEQRYTKGGTSGEGSYGRLATYKAEVLNAFVAKQSISSVIEWGCGDGNQLALAQFPTYLGVDVSETAVSKCRQRFGQDGSKSFVHHHSALTGQPTPHLQAELALSLDVIYHLVEDSIFESYMASLLNSASRYTIIYSSNREQTMELPHVRHRQFDKWIATHYPGWSLIGHIPNRYPQRFPGEPETSCADFFLYEKRPTRS